jgi:hypothetical protein
MTGGEETGTTAGAPPTQKKTETNQTGEKRAGKTGERTEEKKEEKTEEKTGGRTAEKTARRGTTLPAADRNRTADSFPVSRSPMKTGSKAAMPSSKPIGREEQ